MMSIDITKEHEIDGFWDIEYEIEEEYKVKKNVYGKIKISKEKNIIEFFEHDDIFWGVLGAQHIVKAKKISGLTPEGFCILYNISFCSTVLKNNFVYSCYEFEYAVFGDESFLKNKNSLKDELSYSIICSDCYDLLSFKYKNYISNLIKSNNTLEDCVLSKVNFGTTSIQITLRFIRKILLNVQIFPCLEISVQKFNSVEDCIKSIHKIYNLCCFLFNRSSISFDYITIKRLNEVSNTKLFINLIHYKLVENKRLFSIDDSGNFPSYLIGLYQSYDTIFSDYFDNYTKLLTLQDNVQKVVLLVQLIDIIGDKIINKNFPENNIMDTQKLQFKNDIIALCNEKKI